MAYDYHHYTGISSGMMPDNRGRKVPTPQPLDWLELGLGSFVTVHASLVMVIIVAYNLYRRYFNTSNIAIAITCVNPTFHFKISIFQWFWSISFDWPCGQRFPSWRRDGVWAWQRAVRSWGRRGRWVLRELLAAIRPARWGVLGFGFPRGQVSKCHSDSFLFTQLVCAFFQGSWFIHPPIPSPSVLDYILGSTNWDLMNLRP